MACAHRGALLRQFSAGLLVCLSSSPDITDDDDAVWQLHLAALHTDVSPQNFLQRQDSEGMESMDSTTRSQEEDWTTEF
jgi:hypothetical protein